MLSNRGGIAIFNKHIRWAVWGLEGMQIWLQCFLNFELELLCFLIMHVMLGPTMDQIAYIKCYTNTRALDLLMCNSMLPSKFPLFLHVRCFSFYGTKFLSLSLFSNLRHISNIFFSSQDFFRSRVNPLSSEVQSSDHYRSLSYRPVTLLNSIHM